MTFGIFSHFLQKLIKSSVHIFCSERKTRYGTHVHDRPKLRSASTAEISNLDYLSEHKILPIMFWDKQPKVNILFILSDLASMFAMFMSKIKSTLSPILFTILRLFHVNFSFIIYFLK